MDIIKILLIEDNPAHARLIRKLLSSVKPTISDPPTYELHHAERTERALAYLKTIRFDIILLDLFLPDSKNLEAFDRISKVAPNIPIIIISGYSDEQLAIKAMQLGAQDYLTKDDSLVSSILTRAVRYAIERNRLRAQVEKQTAALAASETRRRAIIERNPDGIIIVNKHGTVKFVNPAAEIILNSNKNDLLGQPFSLPRSKGGTAELSVKRKSGDPASIELRFVESEWEGEPVFQVSLRDITIHEEVKAEMRQRTDELMVQNIALDEFAHTMAHQIQGLLSQIIGYASYIDMHYRHANNDEINHANDRIIQSGHKMNNVINELLLLASIRGENIPIVPINMKRIVEEVKKRLRFQIEDNHATIQEPDDWPDVMGHDPWIEEALFNYMNNALKYGGYPPHLEIGSDLKPDGMVTIWVKDNGQGIAEEDISRIFKPHTRLHQMRVRGEGLGLSIVYRIIQRCGGQVGVDSEVDQGSKFWFTLPQAPSKPTHPNK
ncbi:MAG: response regulator [Chloroflexi bacterium]|nr:MAG: response regulator [Chloroflexota bacterium]